jgi:hypothetical protein
MDGLKEARMYGISYRYDDSYLGSYWTTPADYPFQYEDDARNEGELELAQSQEDYRKCAEADIDVPLIVAFVVRER